MGNKMNRTRRSNTLFSTVSSVATRLMERFGKRNLRRQPVMEHFEDRTMLAATYTFGLAGSIATVTPVGAVTGPILIDVAAGNLEWSTDGGTTFSSDWDSTTGGVQTLAASTASTINITLDSGVGSSLTLGTAASPASSILALVNLQGPLLTPANNSLIIDDRSSVHAAGTYDFYSTLGAITGPGGSTGGINFTTFGPLNSYLIEGGPQGNIFNIHSTFNATTSSTSIVGGAGNDTVNVLGNTSPGIGTPLSIDLGGGTNTVHVGNGNLGATITATVAVTDTGGTTSLILDNTSDTSHGAATLDNQSGNGTAPFQVTGLSAGHIEYGTGVTALTINGGTNGAAGVTYSVSNTQSGTTTTINGGANDDAVLLSPFAQNLTGLAGAVVVNGNGGTNSVTLDDQNGAGGTYTITGTTVGAPGFAGLTYGTVTNLTLNAANGASDTINVNGTSTGSTVNLNAGTNATTIFNINSTGTGSNLTATGSAGTDTFNLNAGKDVTTLSGTVTINGAGGTNTATIDDSNSGAGQTFTLTNASLAVAGGVTVNYSNLSGLAINGSSAADTFNLNSFASGVAYTVDGKGGSDSYTVHADQLPSAAGSSLGISDGVGASQTVVLDAGGLAVTTLALTDGASPTNTFAATGHGTVTVNVANSGTTYQNISAASNMAVTVNLANQVNVASVAFGASDTFTLPLGGSVLVPAASIGSIQVNGNASNDTLTLNFGGGNAGTLLPAGGFTFAAGAGESNTLALTNNNAGANKVATETYNPLTAHNGSIVIDGKTVSYTGLSPIIDNLTATNLTVNTLGQIININNGTDGSNADATISSGSGPAFESVDFRNKTNVTVNAAAGLVNTFNLDHTNTVAGLTSLLLDGKDGGDTFNVGTTNHSVNFVSYALTVAGSGTDSLVVDDSAAAAHNYNVSTTRITSSGQGAGSITYNNTVNPIENLTLDTSSGVDTTTITGINPGSSLIVNTPNADVTAGDIYNVTIGGITAPSSVTINTHSTATYNVHASTLAAVLTANESTANPTLAWAVGGNTLLSAGITAAGYHVVADGLDGTHQLDVNLTLGAAGTTTVLDNGTNVITTVSATGNTIQTLTGTNHNEGITATNGPNTFVVNYGAGAHNPIGNSLTFTGNGGADTLDVKSGSVTTQTWNLTGAASGNANIDGHTLAFTSVTTINDSVNATTDNINTLGSNLHVIDVNGANFDGMTQSATINDNGTGSFPTINFGHKTNVNVNTPNSNQTILIDMPALNVPDGLAALVVNGGSGADTFNLNNISPAALNATVNGNDGNDTFNIVGGLANKPGQLFINGNNPTFPASPGDTINLIATGVVRIYTDPTLHFPNTRVDDGSGNALNYINIETFNVETNGTAQILGDEGNTSSKTDTFNVIGTAANQADVRVNSVPADGATIHLLALNHLQVFGYAGTDTLNVTPYGDNTPAGWGVDIAYDGGTGGSDTLNYVPESTQLDRVSNAVTVSEASPSTAHAGQLSALNASTGTTLTVVNFTNVLNVNVGANDGTKGDADSLTVSGNGANNAIAINELNRTVNLDSSSFIVTASANLTKYTVGGGAGDDTFTVSGLAVAPTPAVVIDGGAGNDTITVNGVAATVNNFVYSQGATPGAGTVSSSTAAPGSTRVDFSAIESVGFTGGGAADTFTLNSGPGNDAISVSKGTLVGDASIGINGAVPAIALGSLGAGSTMTLNGGDGSDTITVNQPAVAWNVSGITVNGGTPSFSDTLNLVGGSGTQSFTYNATAGTVAAQNNALATVNYTLTGIEHLNFDGDVGTASLAIVSGGSAIDFSPATATTGAATINLVNAPAVQYKNITTTTLGGGAGTPAALTVEGTVANDTIASTGAQVTVNGTHYGISSVNGLTLNGNGGVDAFNVTHSAIPVVVNGSNSTGGSSLTYIPIGNVSTNLATRTLTDSGASTVNFSGVGTVTPAANTSFTLGGANQEALTITGSAGADAFTYTAGTNTLTAVVGGVTTSYSLAGIQSVSIDGLSGADTFSVVSSTNAIDFAPTSANTGSVAISLAGTPTIAYRDIPGAGISFNAGTAALTVEGTAANDAMLSTGTGVTVNGILYNFSNVNALNLNGNGGSDGFAVANSAIPVIVNGSDSTGGSTLTYTPATAANVSVNLATRTLTETGKSTVSFTGITTIAPGGGTTFSITGGNQSALTITGSGAVDTLAYAAGTNTLTANSVAYLLAGMQSVTIDGISGADTLSIASNSNTIDFAPTSPLAGSVVVGLAGTPNIAYRNVPAAGISLNGGAAASLSVEGTSSNDTFTSTGTHVIVNGSTYSFSNIATLNLNGNGGADAFTVSGSAINVHVNGSDASGGTSLVYNPVGNATVNAAARTITDSGAGATGTVFFTGIGTISPDAGTSFSIGGANQTALTITGSAGADAFTYTAGTNTLTAVVGGITTTYNLAGLQSVSIDGVGGADTFSIASSGNATDFTPTSSLSGSVVVSLAGTPVISYRNIPGAGISLNAGTAALTVEGSASNDAISSTGTGVTVNGTLYSFSNLTTLTLNGNGGADSFSITDSAIPVTVNGSNNTGGATLTYTPAIVANVTVNPAVRTIAETGKGTVNFTGITKIIPGGGTSFSLGGGNQLSLTIAGSGAADTFAYSAATNALTANTVTYNLVGLVNTSIDGVSGADTLSIASNANPIDFAPTSAVDGSVLIGLDGTPTIAYQNIQTTSFDGGAAASLTVEGTSGNDTFTSTGTQVTVNSTPYNFANVAALTLNGDGGADTFTVNGSAVNVHVNGSNASGGSMLVYNAVGATTVDVADRTITDAGAGATGTVTFAGLSMITPAAGTMFSLGGGNQTALTISGTGAADTYIYNAATNTLTDNTTTYLLAGLQSVSIDGVSGADTLSIASNTNAIDFAPTSALNGSVTIGLAGTPAIMYRNIPTTSFDGGTNASLTVEGTSGNDMFESNGIQVTVNNTPYSFTNVATLTLNGNGGADMFHVTGSAVNVNVNGSDSSGGSMLEYFAVGATTVDVANQTITDAGAGATGTVTFAGLSMITPAAGTMFSLGGGNQTALTISGTGAADTYIYNAATNTLTDNTTTYLLAGLQSVSIDGVSGADTLNIASNTNAIDFAPTSALNGSVTIGLAGTPAIMYRNIPTTSFDGGTNASLTVEGTSGNDTFTSNGTQVILNGTPYAYTNVATLTLNGGVGNNSFNVTGSAVNVNVNGGGTIGSDNLNYTGAGSNITVDLAAQTLTETGLAPITFTGIASLNIDTAAASLAVNGTAGPDDLTYTPTGTSAGTLATAGQGLTINFTNISGTFTIDPLGGADTVTMNGTSASDTITVTGGVTTTAQVNGLQAVSLVSANTESLVINGAAGNDTLTVNTGGLLTVPVIYDGGSGNNALVVNAAASSQFTVLTRGADANSGMIHVYNSGTPNAEIDYVSTQVVSPNVSSSANLLVQGADTNEPNNYQATATFLGSAPNIQIPHATIMPDSSQFPGVPADEDFYRVIANSTGTLDFQVYFRLFTGLLPANGQLHIQVLDAAGNILANSADPLDAFMSESSTGDARVRIPAIAGQSYWLRVFGATNAVINGYDATIASTPAPAPYALDLSTDSGYSNTDNITNTNKPTITLNLGDGIFLNDLPGNGTPGGAPVGTIVTPFTNGTGPGFRVAIFDNNSQTPVGFATQTAIPGVYTYTFTTALTEGTHILTSEVQMVDPDLATGFGGRSDSLEITVDTIAPDAPLNPTMIPSSGPRLVFDLTTPVHTLASTAPATAGTFTLSYGKATTDPIAYNATLAVVQKAVRGLPGLTKVIVSGNTLDTAGGLIFTFPVNTVGTGVISINTAGLTPSTGYTISSNGIYTTNVTAPAFAGTAEANSIVRLYAVDPIDPTKSRVIGQGIAGSDLTDGSVPNGQGHYEITVEPLAYGFYVIKATAEDAAGNISVISTGTNIHITDYQLQLAAPVSYPAVAPVAVVTGDLNGDGNIDMVSVDSSGYISTFMNRGHTVFARPIRTKVSGPGSSDVVLGDLNGDGKLDVVVANSISGIVSVLFGKGNGTFGSPQVYKTFRNPTTVQLGDTNGDGKLDIIVTNTDTHRISYLLNKGNGTFGAFTPFIIPGYSPIDFAMADINGDGKLDLVVANNAKSRGIDVLFGNGKGGFYKSQRLITGFSPTSIKVADIDNDGILDIVASTASSKYVSVFQGIGKGLFSDRTRINYIGDNLQAQAIGVADLNSDGYNDLIMVNAKGNTLGVMLGNGNGTFQTMTTMKMGKFYPDPPHAIAVADFNNDGLIDVAVANPITNDVSVFFNSQPGHGDNSVLNTNGYKSLNH